MTLKFKSYGLQDVKNYQYWSILRPLQLLHMNLMREV